ncbi:MAG: YciI family protein [Planctomycetaceae bacterium]
MRRYMLIVKATPEFEAGTFPDEAFNAEAAKFLEDVADAGVLIAADRLLPSAHGKRVHYKDRRFTVTDGPFVETKELVAGYCMIRAASLEEAVAWAKRMPFESGSVDVRPLFELTDFPVDPAEQPGGWREKEEEMQSAGPPVRKPGTTRYLGMLKADRDTEAGVMPDEKALTAMGAFLEEATKSGVLLGGEGLMPSSHAARVQFSGTKRIVTDGPFAETKELVAGYAILQFSTPAEALEWTKRFVEVDAPGRLNGECECEMRPIVE